MYCLNKWLKQTGQITTDTPGLWNKPPNHAFLTRCVSAAGLNITVAVRKSVTSIGSVIILFHRKRHPAEMGAPEVEAFLTHLAVARNVAPATQNQALAAILFLYRVVLSIELPRLDAVTRAKKSPRLPVVLTAGEVRELLAQFDRIHHVIDPLLCGSELRLMEAIRLRIEDVDFECLQVTARDGKGGKDRRTTLPQSLVGPLHCQLDKVHIIHEQDRQNGLGPVYLPYVLARKHPRSGHELGPQYLFSTKKSCTNPCIGIVRRQHLNEKALQRAIKHAVRKTGLTR